jgi:predicted GIY-YIG superfamily endonuclease
MTSSGALTSTRTSLSQALPSIELDRLVYFEKHAHIRDAIAREKQINSWRREKTMALIESLNPKWRDLSLDWQLDDRSQRADKIAAR